jgi:hypothetical protein
MRFSHACNQRMASVAVFIALFEIEKLLHSCVVASLEEFFGYQPST